MGGTVGGAAGTEGFAIDCKGGGEGCRDEVCGGGSWFAIDCKGSEGEASRRMILTAMISLLESDSKLMGGGMGGG